MNENKRDRDLSGGTGKRAGGRVEKVAFWLRLGLALFCANLSEVAQATMAQVLLRVNSTLSLSLFLSPAGWHASSSSLLYLN